MLRDNFACAQFQVLKVGTVKSFIHKDIFFFPKEKVSSMQTDECCLRQLDGLHQTHTQKNYLCLRSESCEHYRNAGISTIHCPETVFWHFLQHCFQKILSFRALSTSITIHAAPTWEGNRWNWMWVGWDFRCTHKSFLWECNTDYVQISFSLRLNEVKQLFVDKTGMQTAGVV